jgi:hypothetical protein
MAYFFFRRTAILSTESQVTPYHGKNMNRMIPVVFLLMILTGLACAQDVSIEATGYGVTKSDATIAAKREALAQGIGQMLTSQTETENFMIKRDLIITETMGHVKSFSVVKELQGPDGAWEVRIKAVVSKEGLAKDLAALKILMQTIGNPRVAVLITETNIDGSSANKAETILLDSLKAKGFKMVDANQALRFRESPDGVKAIGGDPDAAIKLGAKLNAEVIIVGSVVAREADVSKIPAMANSGMKSANATISLKAFNISTRDILAAKSTSQPSVNVNATAAGNQAIEKSVVYLLGAKGAFFEALIESWRKNANDGGTFNVTIEGVDDFSELKAVKAALVLIAPNFEQRNFNKPTLEIDITRSGKADDLAEALDGLKVGNQKLAVEAVQGNALKVKLAGQ